MASGQLPVMNYANYPLKDIPEPHAHDVLCGRGGGTNNHIGNSHWRMLVAANKQLYITLPKRQKMLLSRSIVNAVRSQNPPGRFLQKDGKTKLWFDVGDQRAQEKTSQALREGAPDIRKKVAAAKATTSSSNSTSPTVTPKAPTSGEASHSGAKTDNPKKAQIPVHSSGDRKPESTGSSSILPQTASGGGMIPPIPAPEPQLYNSLQQQQQQQQRQRQQQQMSAMYGGHGGAGHMTLNERGVMIQNAMMNGARGLNGQNHHLQMNSNDANYNSHAAFLYQQQQQQGHLQHQMHQQQDFQQQQQFQFQQQQHNNNANYQQEQRQRIYQQQQQQQLHGNNNGSMSSYDGFAAPPPPEELDRDGLSFGSLHMTDAEMHNLQQGSSHGKTRNRNNKNGNGMPAAPMGGVLEPTGISFGDVSMHSTMSNLQMKLEENGASFGTMMSYNTLNTTNHSINPEMVDGGLMDAVGTSFGSLSLDKSNRDMLFKTLEIAGGGSEVPLMFRSETKSSANLLDCSDTESESSRDKEQLTKQKSQAWEMMKTQLDKQTSKGTINSQDLMPPPVGVPQSNGTNNGNSNKNAFDNIEIALPPTTMEANFSTLSAWSAADDEYNEPPSGAKGGKPNGNIGNDGDDDDAAGIPPPPPELTKVDSF